ncbi:hypothetical protein HDG38_001825 [Paraburkholderia sp. WSM4177]|nr:hypothetical protein [Paraburkholderia sp. WSM4177]MBB5483179.1 hypothetical protein [Paraburkholderia sp. WSM4180]
MPFACRFVCSSPNLVLRRFSGLVSVRVIHGAPHVWCFLPIAFRLKAARKAAAEDYSL